MNNTAVSQDERAKHGRNAGIVGIAVNVVLFAVKLAVGIISGSLSVAADAVNNLSDALSSIFVLVGYVISAKPADKDHPYGHGRTEYLTGLIISVMVLVIGLSLLKSSVDKIIHPEALEFSFLTIFILIAAIAIKLWQAGFNVSLGKAIDSDALMATAADSRNDVISTSAVLVSVILGKILDINFDGYTGVIVALFIIWSGIGLVKEALGPILGQAPDPKLIDAIEENVLSHDKILGVHDLIVHDYGPGRLFASLHAEVNAEENIMEIHDLIDNIELEVYTSLRVLLTIHMDPLDVNDPLVQKVNEQLTEIIKDHPDILSFHDVRVVSGSTHINLVFDIVLDFKSKHNPKEIKELLQSELRKYDPKYNCVITVDRAYS